MSSPPVISESGACAGALHEVEAPQREAGRSPAVSVAIAVGALGCLLATAGDTALPHLPWTLLLLCVAIESEVRLVQLPIWLASTMLAGCLALVAFTASPHELCLALTGVLIFPTALLPFLLMREISPGSLIVVAALGALWGPAAIPVVIFWVFFLGLPFAFEGPLRELAPGSIPLIGLIALASALYQVVPF